MSNQEIDVHGNEIWRDNKGGLHRLDGPAIVYIKGREEWYKNNKLHREDGPAITNQRGTKYWYVNGMRHRLDGPAMEYPNGDKFWWVNGVEVSGPKELLKYGARVEDIAEYLTPREIAKIKLDK